MTEEKLSVKSKNFSRNKKNLIGCLVVGVVLVCGLLIWNSTKSTVLIKKQVTITTDKTEYEQGETVKITIQNNQEETLDICGISVCSTFNSLHTQIEEYMNDKWQRTLGFCPQLPHELWKLRKIKDNKDCYIIHPKNLLNIEIESFLQKTAFNGNKRMRIVYYLGDEKDIIYSNEFTIKEKLALDPRCSEKVRGGCSVQRKYCRIRI